jgi:hypothetical protein
MNSSTWFLEQLFVYVAVLLAYSRRVIGWALSSSRAAVGPRIELFLFQCLNEVFASPIIPRRPGRLMLSTAPHSSNRSTYSTLAYWVPCRISELAAVPTARGRFTPRERPLKPKKASGATNATTDFRPRSSGGVSRTLSDLRAKRFGQSLLGRLIIPAETHWRRAIKPQSLDVSNLSHTVNYLKKPIAECKAAL